jgi:hypothetical protein
MADPAVPDPGARPGRGLRRPSRVPFVLAAVVALGVVGWLLWQYRGRPAPPAVEPPGAAAPGAAVPSPAEDPAAVPQPPPATSREALEPASSHPLYRACLGEDDPVRRFVVLVDNLALGTSPRRALGCLAPDRPFTVVRRDDRWFVAPEAHARYDRFAEAVRSLDPAPLAAAYRRFHAPLEAAYRLLGYPTGSLDRATSDALARLERFVPPQEPLEVAEGKGAVWEYVRPELEQAGAIEKHLLRLGPANARAVQEKARALRAALGLPAAR